MKPYYEDESVTLYAGDNRHVLATLPDASVDACVTDPPYELAFMGRKWDAEGIAYDASLWREVLRVLKPGGHLLAFGGTRTWHRLAVAVEDAGFEVRDSIAWMYGSGFPKSLDVSKAIDKNNGETGRRFKFTAWMQTTGLTARQINDVTNTAMGNHYTTHPTQPAIPTPDVWAVLRPLCGDVPPWVDELVDRIAAEREVVGQRDGNLLAVAPGQDNDRSATVLDITAPATPEAQRWQGWGTALKPAFEPIVVARKPLVGTVAENVLRYGTGALNVDGGRVAIDPNDPIHGAVWTVRPSTIRPGSAGFVTSNSDGDKRTSDTSKGRWPANVILDEHQAAELDRQSGVTSSTERVGPPGGTTFGGGDMKAEVGGWYGGTGGASRFFYTAKADASERPRVDGVAHPTVKPLDLMRYLVRLVTRPGGVVLEPFAGSGTTAEACVVEGFRCIAIEREADYLPLIVSRLTKPIEVTLL